MFEAEISPKKEWATEKVQKSLSFILPYLNLSKYHNSITNSYMGADYLTPPDDTSELEWGDSFILEIDKNKKSQKFCDELEANTYFKFKIDVGEDKEHYVFEIPENIKEDVVNPFLDGKYSKIASWYKAKFNRYSPDGTINTNYQILYKLPQLRSTWEFLIGQELPKDAEVWSKPLKEKEIYGFKRREDNLD